MLKFLSFLPTHWTRRVVHTYGLIRNPFTLGVRVIVENGQGHFLLVRHSYLQGWYLPGGAVDGKETFHEAALREVEEEVGIVANSAATLLTLFLNDGGLGRDHVALFHLVDWGEGDAYLKPNREILEARFFAINELPDDISPATRYRLKEFCENRLPAGGRWSRPAAGPD